jgi:serine/threonine protein kinase
VSQQQLVEKVGKGAFGIVYKALHFETGNHVAIKRLSKEGINEKMLLNLKVPCLPLRDVPFPGTQRHGCGACCLPLRVVGVNIRARLTSSRRWTTNIL